MSMRMIQEKTFLNFKATLWASTVEIKNDSNVEFGYFDYAQHKLWNGAERQDRRVAKRDRERT